MYEISVIHRCIVVCLGVFWSVKMFSGLHYMFIVVFLMGAKCIKECMYTGMLKCMWIVAI